MSFKQQLLNERSNFWHSQFSIKLLTNGTSVIVQGLSEKDSPKKGDKAAAKQAEPKKAAADAAAASPKTDSKLKKRTEVEMEAKFISK